MTAKTKDLDLLKLGANIRKYRLKNDLSQVKLSIATGLHWNYIGQLERGEVNPGATVLIKLAKALNIAVGELFE